MFLDKVSMVGFNLGKSGLRWSFKDTECHSASYGTSSTVVQYLNFDLFGERVSNALAVARPAKCNLRCFAESHFKTINENQIRHI